MVAIGILIGVGGLAVAAIPDSSGVIHGCYQKGAGNLRVVNSASDCRPSERSIDWNQQGPPGTARAFAHVLADGSLDPTESKNVRGVVHSSVPDHADTYCFDLDFRPANVVATPQGRALQMGASLEAEDIAPYCPPGFRDAAAFTQSSITGGPFYIAFQ